ncbi:MAG TPA: hypothetical protein VM370_02900 [Candidatus Thermoplasmatota archaeon]|nr:hypothetical protein [Candidatus Thermoplasmatota archaeon]
MSRRFLLLAVVALLALPSIALPSVLAHGGVEDQYRYNTNRPQAIQPQPDIPEGYTGPGREPYLSYFEGAWLYGKMSATPINGQHPADMDVDGDWVVWEDAARSDIYAYSISAGQGYYITNDNAAQHHPRVSGNVVVFEDHRSALRPGIYAYFLDTGETRRLSDANRSVGSPDIMYPIVAWVDENITNADVWGYSLLNNTGWNLHDGTDRDSNPVVVRDSVFWRTYRYNLWDMVGYDTHLGEMVQVTTDGAIQSAPLTNGRDLLFLTNYYTFGWTVERYDLDEGLVKTSDYHVGDSRPSAASGDALLRIVQDVDYSQMIIHNLTSGATNHVSGNLVFTTAPVIQEHTVFASLVTKEGASLLVLQVSPFALAKKPTVTITNPGDNAAWVRPLSVAGLLEAGPEFTEPTTFTYRLDNEAPQIIPPAERWRFTLDPNGVEPGAHTVTVRATFREGPPIQTGITLNIPAPGQSIDVARAGPAFHAARVLGELHNYVLDNPASWFLIPLVLLIFALLIVRFWIWLKPRRKRTVAEFVSPEDYA